MRQCLSLYHLVGEQALVHAKLQEEIYLKLPRRYGVFIEGHPGKTFLIRVKTGE